MVWWEILSGCKVGTVVDIVVQLVVLSVCVFPVCWFAVSGVIALTLNLVSLTYCFSVPSERWRVAWIF